MNKNTNVHHWAVCPKPSTSFCHSGLRSLMYFGLRAGRGCYPGRPAQCGFPWLAVHSRGVQQHKVHCSSTIETSVKLPPVSSSALQNIRKAGSRAQGVASWTGLNHLFFGHGMLGRFLGATAFHRLCGSSLGGLETPFWLTRAWVRNSNPLQIHCTTKSNFAVWDHCLFPFVLTHAHILACLVWPLGFRIAAALKLDWCARSERLSDSWTMKHWTVLYTPIIPKPGAWLRLSYLDDHPRRSLIGSHQWTNPVVGKRTHSNRIDV